MAEKSNENGLPVLITGSSRGVGLETAICLAEQGFRVYATMRYLDKKQAIEKAARTRNLKIHIVQLDVLGVFAAS